MAQDRARRVTLFLAGDVMTGRGIDHVLPHPGDPRLYESYVKSAADYVALAEKANGPIRRPVAFDYVWGDALDELDRRRPDVRVINLETVVTTAAQPEPKGINYRMNPANIPVISAAGIDVCSLANNHLLDWGTRGLVETLETLAGAGVTAVGAGRTLDAAEAPAVLPVSGARVAVFAFGSPTSGIPRHWAATASHPGVNLLTGLGPNEVDTIAEQVEAGTQPGDIVVVSLHWGGNWGYDIPSSQVRFAHALIDDAGVDIVFGHSSHHAKAAEVYRGKLILYGCGDFLNDYEGITGYEQFRDDLAVMYFPTVLSHSGALQGLTMVPLTIRKFRLNRTSRPDAEWLRNVLDREGRRFGSTARLESDNSLTLEWR